MDLCVFIADPDGYRRSKIEKEVERLSLIADIQKLSFWHCERTEVLDHLQKKHWQMLKIAFVSLDFEDVQSIGDILYHHNPSCRLVYYGKEESQIRNLLPSRPVWYWDCRNLDALQDIFNMQMEAMKDDPYFFYYSDRMRSLAVSIDSIQYAYSLKRAVYLHTETEDLGPLPRSLDEIQKMLPNNYFTRVHQSFLVNNNYVRRLNKSTKTLHLINNTEIPVSRALYEQARLIFGQNDSPDDQNDGMTDI